VFTIEFPYEQSARKRHITLARQAELRRELGSREFDIAIDLCFGHMTRPLLRLAQAKCTVGFWPQEFPWLDFGLDVRSRDVVTGGYRLPQQALCNLLIDGLWSAAQHTSVHRVRPDLDWSALEPFGIEPETPYFLLHTGVRTPARRWPIPHFVALARLLVARTGHRVIMVADEPALFDDDSRALLAIDGIHLIDHRLSFDVLDTLISLCAVYVATDSGPKHLAAYRGVPVVSIQHGPLSWSEWGQDGVGLIIAHRVPCSGCGVELAEDCGKDMICVSSITPETVFQAVQAEMRRSAAESAEARRTSRDLGSIAEILETDEAVGVVDFDP
jgi:ADP-heptose:LPS heptosyltransferase